MSTYAPERVDLCCGGVVRLDVERIAAGRARSERRWGSAWRCDVDHRSNHVCPAVRVIVMQRVMGRCVLAALYLFLLIFYAVVQFDTAGGQTHHARPGARAVTARPAPRPATKWWLRGVAGSPRGEARRRGLRAAGSATPAPRTPLYRVRAALLHELPSVRGLRLRRAGARGAGGTAEPHRAHQDGQPRRPAASATSHMRHRHGPCALPLRSYRPRRRRSGGQCSMITYSVLLLKKPHLKGLLQMPHRLRRVSVR